MTILVSGSLALDHIMVFPDRFENHILPDKLDALNVSFNITDLEKHFGGVAGNIAYHLRLLGADPLILATAGADFGSYRDWLDQQRIRRDGIREFDDVQTAQGFVTTDRGGSQIWAFYEGAMARAEQARVEDVSDEIEIGIVSANGRQAMVEHARALKARGVPTYIDPSHGLPILSKDELLEMIDGATGYFVNDYEWSLTLERAGLSESEVESRCETVIITLGAEGCEIRSGGDRIRVPGVPASQVLDPTGCGDAFRAGFLYAISSGRGLEAAGRLGGILGSRQVEVAGGPQVLTDGLEAFCAYYERVFGTSF